MSKSEFQRKLDTAFNTSDNKQRLYEELIARGLEQDLKDKSFKVDIDNFLDLLNQHKYNLGNERVMRDALIKGYHSAYPTSSQSDFDYFLRLLNNPNGIPVASPSKLLDLSTYEDALVNRDELGQNNLITMPTEVSSSFTGSKDDIPSYVPQHVQDWKEAPGEYDSYSLAFLVDELKKNANKYKRIGINWDAFAK